MRNQSHVSISIQVGYWRVELKAMNSGFSASRKVDQNLLITPTEAKLDKYKVWKACQPIELSTGETSKLTPLSLILQACPLTTW